MPSMFEFSPTADEFRRDVAAPLHQQISDAIRTRIVSGEWPRDHRLSPEPQLAEEIGVSRGTLRRALATLLKEGLLRQVPGRGTFVAEAVVGPEGAQSLSTLAEDLASQGIDLETRVLESELVAPPFAVAQLLHLAPGQLVLRLVRIRSAEGQPIALLHNYVRADLAPGIEKLDFARMTLFGALEERYNLDITSARRNFSAVLAPEEVIRELELSEGLPVQHLEQLTFLGEGTPVEYSDVWIDSRRLRVTTHMTRRTPDGRRAAE